MKSLFSKCTVVLLTAGFLGIAQLSQAQIDSAVEQLDEKNARGYVQPLITALGNDLNAGWYRSADLPRLGLHFYLGLVGMASFVLDEDRTFWATPPPPFSQTPVETATALGDEGAEIQDGEGFKFPDGLTSAKVIPMAVPQVEIGGILGTMILARYFTGEAKDDEKIFSKVSLWGLGVRHSLSQHIFLCPLNLTAGVFYQRLKVSDILSGKTITFGVQASKSFAFLDVYGGVSLESSHWDVNYLYTYPGGSRRISFNLKGKDKYKITAGVALKLAGLILNADYSLGNRNVVTAGVGFGL